MAAATVDLVVTSPPYNLGIAYGHYSDRQDREGYLDWCHEWAAQIRRLLKPDGSLFLNLGASPSNPMLPHEFVLRLRDLFVLQNTIHWIKSITIEDRQGRGSILRAFQADQFAALSERLPRIHFPLHARRPTSIDRLALGVPYAGQEQHRALVAHAGQRSALPRQHLVHSLRNNSASRAKNGRIRRRFPSSWRELHQAARRHARRNDARSVSRYWKFRGRGQTLRREDTSSASRSTKNISPRRNGDSVAASAAAKRECNVALLDASHSEAATAEMPVSVLGTARTSRSMPEISPAA